MYIHINNRYFLLLIQEINITKTMSLLVIQNIYIYIYPAFINLVRRQIDLIL